MATVLPCDMCEQEQADIIVTNLGNGDTMAVGAACLPLLGQQLMAQAPPPEGLPEISEGDGSWPGDIDLDGLPPGMDATMAKAWKEAEAQALAELQAEAEAVAAQVGFVTNDPPVWDDTKYPDNPEGEPREAAVDREGGDTPGEASEAASDESEQPETAV